MDHADPQQWHGYSYISNSPVTFADPDGLKPVPNAGEGVIVIAPSGGSLGKAAAALGAAVARAVAEVAKAFGVSLNKVNAEAETFDGIKVIDHTGKEVANPDSVTKKLAAIGEQVLEELEIGQIALSPEQEDKIQKGRLSARAGDRRMVTGNWLRRSRRSPANLAQTLLGHRYIAPMAGGISPLKDNGQNMSDGTALRSGKASVSSGVELNAMTGSVCIGAS